MLILRTLANCVQNSARAETQNSDIPSFEIYVIIILKTETDRAVVTDNTNRKS